MRISTRASYVGFRELRCRGEVMHVAHGDDVDFKRD